MALAFQRMLESLGLSQKVLAFNADNATSNDTQTTKLAVLDNSFEEVNRVRCFNHTIQLSAKELIRPFNAGMSPGKNSTLDATLDEDLPPPDDTDSGDEESEGEDSGDDDADDNIDEMNELDEDEQAEILADTAIVRKTVTKVMFILYTIIPHYLSHISRFDSSHSRSSTRRQLPFQHGVKCVLIRVSSQT